MSFAIALGVAVLASLTTGEPVLAVVYGVGALVIAIACGDALHNIFGVEAFHGMNSGSSPACRECQAAERASKRLMDGTKQSAAVGPDLGVGSESDELVSLRARIKDLESELAAAKPDAESRADVVSAPVPEASPIQAVAIQPPDDEEAARKAREERLRALLVEMSH